MRLAVASHAGMVLPTRLGKTVMAYWQHARLIIGEPRTRRSSIKLRCPLPGDPPGPASGGGGPKGRTLSD